MNKNESPFPANVQYGDIVSGLPVADGSCRLLYCSHVLEHLSLEDLETAIRNSFDTLQPGGVWRLVLPDLRQLADSYLSDTDHAAAERFMIDTGLGISTRPRSLKSRIAQAYGNSGHLWMWDYPSLSKRLAAAGFTAIRSANYGDSEFADFADVERPERWANCLGIQCRKPDEAKPI